MFLYTDPSKTYNIATQLYCVCYDITIERILCLFSSEREYIYCYQIVLQLSIEIVIPLPEVRTFQLFSSSSAEAAKKK